MIFYSVAFLGFVAICILIHELVGKFCPKFQWVVRLLASLVFFTYISRLKIIFVLISALSIFLGAKWITYLTAKNKAYRKTEGLSKEEKKASKQKCTRNKRLIVALIIVVNLSLLFIAKYLLPIMERPIALPLGISYYSLQAIAYIVDVYGEKYESQNNLGKLLLYLTWFPQLLQGPINRYDLIEEDLYKPMHLHMPDFRYAFYLFLFGAIKKYAIADLLSPIVGATLNLDAANLPGSSLLFGAVLFAIEQYANFSGGIDMAMAISLLFGIKMNINFKQPYMAKSLAEFWRRWHISLGSFMRDYVFYPFVMTKPISKLTKKISDKWGNHMGRAVTGGISNLIVFALVGLWHGPQLHYLAWGLYNGVIIAVSDALTPVFGKMRDGFKIKDDNKAFGAFQILRTFMIIVFAGYFDVIESVRVGLTCFKRTFTAFSLSEGLNHIGSLFENNTTSVRAVVTIIVACVILLVISILRERGKSPIHSLCVKRYYFRWVLCYIGLFVLLYSFTVSSGTGGFMYAVF